jgi:DNA polymerase III delta subunit
MVHLLLGEDSVSKDIKLKSLRLELLDKNTEQFNLDILYAKELTLKDLQEKLIYLPIKSSRRITVIKNTQDLKEEIKDFILTYIKKPNKQVILVLDVNQQSRSQGFVNRIQRYAKVYRFKETRQPDAFTLNRWIDLKRPDYALRLLNQLLKNGERPERILGALRYAWERDAAVGVQMKKRLRLLLNCDIEIKTGKLKPVFALEKLVISLCCLGKPFS